MSSPSDKAQATASQLAAQHYENFPVGSFLLPRKLRVHVRRLYAFARVADDLADEAQDLEALQAWRRASEAALSDDNAQAEQAQGLLRELATTVHERKLDRALLFRLLDAFERDLRQDRYADWPDLLSYCKDSADPVGRLMLQLVDRESPENAVLSDRICSGLQILNHAQDVQKDWHERRRVYLPRTVLEAHGIQESDLEAELTAPSASPRMRRCIQDFADFARAAFQTGWPLPKRIGGRFGLELASILAAASLVLERLDACQYDSFAHKPRIHKRDAPRILLRALSRIMVPSLKKVP